MWSAKCPKCGAKILLEDANAKVVQCASCGAQVRVNINVNYNYSKSEHTEHIVDDAKIKAAENANRVREAERAKQWRACEKKILKVCRKHPKETLLSLIVCAVLFFSGIAAWSSHATKQQQLADHQAELSRLKDEEIAASHLAMGEVKMPEIEIGVATDYRIVKQDFENAGFINITAEPVADLTDTTTKRYNAVIEVTVDGVPRMNVGDWYKVDVPIVITYHTVGDTILTPQEKAYSIAQGLLHGKQD